MANRKPSGTRSKKTRKAVRARPGGARATSGVRARKAARRSPPSRRRSSPGRTQIWGTLPDPTPGIGGENGRSDPPPPPPSATIEERALALFEKALRAFQRRDLDRAEELFRRLHDAFPEERELLARSVSYLAALARQRETVKRTNYRSSEEMARAAVVLLNSGQGSEAARLLERCRDRARDEGRKSRTHPDYLHYLLAAAYSLSGDVEAAFQNLRRAISLNDQNRMAALGDPDFESLRSDPRFQALVRPSAR